MAEQQETKSNFADYLMGMMKDAGAKPVPSAAHVEPRKRSVVVVGNKLDAAEDPEFKDGDFVKSYLQELQNHFPLERPRRGPVPWKNKRQRKRESRRRHKRRAISRKRHGSNL